MALNNGKVIAGGLVAGVVISAVGWVVDGMILGERMKIEADHFKPGMSDAMMSSNAITMNIICNFVLGLVLVYAYAAVRPRLGPGPRTAAVVAFLFWIIAGVVAIGYLQSGMMSVSLGGEYALFWLIMLLLGAVAGAAIYSEEGSPTTA
jgi:hypothetical protein